jgi:hypothetical protein
METNDWRVYERFIARLQSKEATDDLTVIPNAILIGNISGAKRQIDVLIDARWAEDISRRVIVDAKRYKRKVHVKDVESFEGMMRDCRAQHGILVCPHGYSKAAFRRAKDAITIKLVALSDLKDFDLMAWDECAGACSRPDAKITEQGLVLWDSPFGLAVADSPLSIVAVGKCDVCHNFQIWCWDCGQKFALQDEDEYKCNCNRFWLTSIEEEVDNPQGEIVQAVHLFLCLNMGVVIPVDRRKLS